MQADRRALNEDEARLRALRDETMALGYDELGRAETGTLRKPQQEMIDAARKEQDTRTKEYYQRAGLSGTQAEKGQEWQNQINELLLKETMRESAWEKAIVSFGFAREEAMALIQLNKERRQESMQVFQGLMGAIGGLMGMFTKSGGGGA